LKRLIDWLDRSDFDGIIISRRDNFTWLVNSRNWVLANSPVGIAALYIPRQLAASVDTDDAGTDMAADAAGTDKAGAAADGVAVGDKSADGNNKIVLIADTIDGRRILEEELSCNCSGCGAVGRDSDITSPNQLSTGFELLQYPWYSDSASFFRDFIGDRKIASDTGIVGTVNVQDDLVEIRSILSESEQTAYRHLGLKCAEIVEDICRSADSEMTENQIAIMVRKRCVADGISPDCVLVGSDERIMKYRHPMPTEKTINHLLMIVLGAEQGGLNVSLTRFVSFGKPSSDYLERFVKTQQIFAQMQGLTQDGMAYSTFFRHVQKLYNQAGYADEWQKHHQGGPTGYACREKIIAPTTPGSIRNDQAYAWNPTINGTKAEDTTLLTADGIEILTRTNNWPVTYFDTPNGAISVADILVL
jgi:Xaa-Pro aminopeptidase